MKSLFVLAGVAVSLVLVAASNAPAFGPSTSYVGPATFDGGTAAQLEAWGATAVKPDAIPSSIGSSAMIIFGECPDSLGIDSASVLAWLNQGVMLAAVGCSEADLFSAAGGVGQIVGMWLAEGKAPSSSTGLTGATDWWNGALERNSGIASEWSYLALRNGTLESGVGRVLPQLLTLNDQPPQAE